MPFFEGDVRERRRQQGVGNRDLISRPASRLVPVTFMP